MPKIHAHGQLHRYLHATYAHRYLHSTNAKNKSHTSWPSPLIWTTSVYESSHLRLLCWHWCIARVVRGLLWASVRRHRHALHALHTHTLQLLLNLTLYHLLHVRRHLQSCSSNCSCRCGSSLLVDLLLDLLKSTWQISCSKVHIGRWLLRMCRGMRRRSRRRRRRRLPLLLSLLLLLLHLHQLLEDAGCTQQILVTTWHFSGHSRHGHGHATWRTAAGHGRHAPWCCTRHRWHGNRFTIHSHVHVHSSKGRHAICCHLLLNLILNHILHSSWHVHATNATSCSCRRCRCCRSSLLVR
mmetsp:Transcript_25462/g.41028  ORF Transcript_25462/g.41028 Transcript_25462/m.41028 type:complete len:297 (+) Transcript_25462:1415-2305(+)